jgi:hypothetical protein
MMLALPKTVRPLIRFGVSAQTILAYSRSGMGGRSPTFRDDTEHPFGSKGAARAGEQRPWRPIIVVAGSTRESSWR